LKGATRTQKCAEVFTWHCTLVDGDCIKNISPEDKLSSIFFISWRLLATIGGYAVISLKWSAGGREKKETIDCQIAQRRCAIVLDILVRTPQELDEDWENSFADQKGAILRCNVGSVVSFNQVRERREEKKRKRKKGLTSMRQIKQRPC